MKHPHFPDTLDPVEAKIIAALAMIVVKSSVNNRITVLDEMGEIVQPATDQLHLIHAATGHTDVTTFAVTTGPRFVGRFTLQHGKGTDVIAHTDWTTEKAREMMQGYLKHALWFGARIEVRA